MIAHFEVRNDKLPYAGSIDQIAGFDYDSSTGIIYTGSFNDGVFNSINISNPYAPTLLGTVSSSVYGSSTLLYSDDVAIVNIPDGDKIALVAIKGTAALRGMITFVNITNPVSPQILFSFNESTNPLCNYNLTDDIEEYNGTITLISSGDDCFYTIKLYDILFVDPDITVTDASIFFDNTSLVEGYNLMLYANVTNNGSDDIEGSFIAQFYLGDPLLGGVQIGDNITITNLDIGEIKTINTTYMLASGVNDIFLYIDENYIINESNESNNNVNITINISIYQKYYGNVTANLMLGPSNNSLFFSTINLTDFKGTVFITDSDSVFAFSDLQALGRDVNGFFANTDFSDIDFGMNTSGFYDSINYFWANGNDLPISLRTFNISSQITIFNVSVINSSVNSIHETGILWDTSDDFSNNNEYDTSDKEDVVFVTSFDTLSSGSEEYLYEIKVPALLKKYVGTTDTVSLYYIID
ncbi:MAG: CARDB domain-containing protein [Candidatus Woesearchaeota archaeon]